jgi:serine/threonine protein kinase
VDANLDSGDEGQDLSELAAGGEGAQVGGRLAPGTALAQGRIQIAERIGRTVFGEVYRATDRSTGMPVAVRLLDNQIVGDASGWERLQKVVAGVSRMDHKNIARTLECGAESGMAYVVTELVDGSPLRALLSRKRASGGAAFSLKGAYNVVAHVCNGLAYAHQATWHGALSASNVLVNKAGRVKITEFGLARAFPMFTRFAADFPGDLAAVSPEIINNPASADARADVFSTGAILYELITGHEPSAQLVRPSAAQPGLSPEVDQIVARCLARNPAERFADLATLKNALQQAVERGGAQATQVPRTTRPPGAGGSSSSLPKAAPAPGPRVSAANVAMADESEEKWLVQKGKLDFGPFSFAQIKQQIAADQIEPGHVIMDNENGQRCKVEDHPLLHDLVMSAAQRRDDARRAHAEHVVVKQDKHKGLALFGFIGLGIVVVGLGVFFVVKAVKGSDKSAQRDEIASLESGKIAAEIKLVDVVKRPPRDPSKPRGPRVPRAAGGGGGGFDDALDLGDAEDGAESETLSNSQINPVLQRYGGKLGGCLARSGERHGNIEFIVKGSGKVSAVRVNGSESSGLAGCVRGVMSGMQFPSFNGPRTRASFDMSI